ncbi:GNAT family N-acetyltransferase [Gemmatimonas sp.]|uniref:GNAT family N-acetyltransferase n=1 Tax=Gemmatimonas sp. TaxID=1962908 RepID=UPI003F72A4B0
MKHAYRNDQAGIGRAYVILDAPDADEILGYYTLSASSATPELLKAVLGSALPKYPLPVSYIGMFAVTTSRQGQGIGSELMLDALMRSAAAAHAVGSTGVFLHSRDEKSTAFYAKLGFVSLGTEATRRPMFIPMSVVHRMMNDQASRRAPRDTDRHDQADDRTSE